MTAVSLWIASVCQPDPGYGGYGFVRLEGETRAGQAGGDRRTTGLKMALTGLIRALESLAETPAGTLVTLNVADADTALGLRRLLAADPEFAPEDETKLWAQLAAIARPRAARIGVVALPANAPAAGFVKAWADFGADAAKTRGAFKAAIPRPNLLKFPV